MAYIHHAEFQSLRILSYFQCTRMQRAPSCMHACIQKYTKTETFTKYTRTKTFTQHSAAAPLRALENRPIGHGRNQSLQLPAPFEGRCGTANRSAASGSSRGGGESLTLNQIVHLSLVTGCDRWSLNTLQHSPRSVCFSKHCQVPLHTDMQSRMLVCIR